MHFFMLCKLLKFEVLIHGFCYIAAKFVDLTTLNMGYTSMNGSFPRDIVDCAKLVILNLTNTSIGGKVRQDIINLRYLEVLDLSHANMVGTGVVDFNKLQQLRVV